MRYGFWAVWLAFIVYAFGFAPPDLPPGETLSEIVALATFQRPALEVALFNLLGVLPLLYLFLLVPDGYGQKWPALPFGLAAFAVGAFALLPYLGLRQSHQQWPDPSPDGWLRRFDSKGFALAVSAAAIALLVYALLLGDWPAFVERWRSVRLYHVMGIDFLLLSVLFAALVGDDLARRGLPRNAGIGRCAWLPLLGLIAYLVLRPPLVKQLHKT